MKKLFLLPALWLTAHAGAVPKLDPHTLHQNLNGQAFELGCRFSAARSARSIWGAVREEYSTGQSSGFDPLEQILDDACASCAQGAAACVLEYCTAQLVLQDERTGSWKESGAPKLIVFPKEVDVSCTAKTRSPRIAEKSLVELVEIKPKASPLRPGAQAPRPLTPRPWRPFGPPYFGPIRPAPTWQHYEYYYEE